MAFPRKTDPNGDFVRYWIPELQKIPAKFIYEPWDAPLSTQKAASLLSLFLDDRRIDHSRAILF